MTSVAGAPPSLGRVRSGPLTISTSRRRGAIIVANLRVAELLQQAEHVAVDRLLPDAVPVPEVAADANGLDPRVERPGIQRQHPALAVADDANLRILAAFLREPVHGGQHLLHLVADQVPPHLERRAVQELAARQVGPAVALLQFAVDQHRHDDAAAALGQAARELRFLRHARHSPTICSGVWSASGMATTSATFFLSPFGTSSSPSP